MMKKPNIIIQPVGIAGPWYGYSAISEYKVRTSRAAVMAVLLEEVLMSISILRSLVSHRLDASRISS